MVLMASIQAVGILLFLSDKNVTTTEIEKTEKQIGHVMKNRVVVLMIALGTVLVASFAGMEIPTVALIDKSLSGAVVAVFSVGSILGGLVLGHRSTTRWSTSVLFALLTAGYALAMLWPESPIWLAVCWFVGGIAVAPLLGSVNARISSSTKEADALEAYGWLNTGQLLGYSAAAIAVGFLIDNVTAAAGLWVAIGFSFIGLCVSLIPTRSPEEAQ
jgi:predicted MFS family arabinose efflux permease